MVAMLGLDPDVPAGVVGLQPSVPPGWGRIDVTDIPVGRERPSIKVQGRRDLDQQWRSLVAAGAGGEHSRLNREARRRVCRHIAGSTAGAP